MEGWELYQLYVAQLAGQDCSADEFDELDEVDQIAWNRLAAMVTLNAKYQK